MKTIDTILMGIKTYDVAKQYGFSYFKGKSIYVFTKSKSLKGEEGCEMVNEDPISFTKKLKKSKGKNIWLMGGGELDSTFQKRNLIDEYSFFVHPIVLGEGIPLFKNLPKIYNLKLRGYKKFDSGLVRMNYSK